MSNRNELNLIMLKYRPKVPSHSVKNIQNHIPFARDVVPVHFTTKRKLALNVAILLPRLVDVGYNTWISILTTSAN